MKNKINIGIVGFGVVGSHSAKVLTENKEYFLNKTGLEIEIKKICDTDWNKKRIWMPSEKQITTDFNEIINASDIDIVVELIGKENPAEQIIKNSLKNKKSVVTANKFLLSTKLFEILQLSNENKSYLGFEASVAGAIPIIKSIKEGFLSNNITRITAILNGTTNFILSSMTKNKIEFDQTLKNAQNLGYAESNPSLDISGMDTAQKLAILSTFAFHKNIIPDDFVTKGIEKIGQLDIEYAKQLGYKIKLLAFAVKENETIELSVQPALISENHPLSSIEDVYNGIYLEGDLFGKALFYGEGAGGYAAGSAIISDILDIGKKIAADIYLPEKFYMEENLKIKPSDEIISRYYLCFTAIDEPGVLAEISKILGNNGISISSVIQKEENPKQAVPIVILTHQTPEKNLKKAVNEIDKLSVIKKPTQIIKIE
jgi:homoserine dehydrogenase